MSGIAARYLFMIVLLSSAYRYRFAMLLPIGQLFPEHTVSHLLCPVKVFYIWKWVIVHGVRDSLWLEQPREVFMPIQIELDIVWEPGLYSEEHPAKLLIIIIKIVVLTFGRSGCGFQMFGGTVWLYRVLRRKRRRQALFCQEPVHSVAGRDPPYQSVRNSGTQEDSPEPEYKLQCGNEGYLSVFGQRNQNPWAEHFFGWDNIKISESCEDAEDSH